MVRGYGGAEPSQRQLKVAEEMRHLIAADLMRGEVHGLPGDGANVTVAEVRVSRDLRQATVFATELGGRLSPETRAALDHAAAWLGGRLARRMHLKFAPRLEFMADDTFGEANRIARLIDEEHKAIDSERAAEDGDGTTQG
jgi:ribosome-binding factor A